MQTRMAGSRQSHNLALTVILVPNWLDIGTLDRVSLQIPGSGNCSTSALRSRRPRRPSPPSAARLPSPRPPRTSTPRTRFSRVGRFPESQGRDLLCTCHVLSAAVLNPGGGRHAALETKANNAEHQGKLVRARLEGNPYFTAAEDLRKMEEEVRFPPSLPRSLTPSLPPRRPAYLSACLPDTLPLFRSRPLSPSLSLQPSLAV